MCCSSPLSRASSPTFQRAWECSKAVFIALLSHRIPQAELLAALLAYRAIYYLMPLALALGLFVKLEAGAKRLRGTFPGRGLEIGAPCR